jgi:(E)-4-hydroxy-3-methylbut-2-enyl-diphosphate synthase
MRQPSGLIAGTLDVMQQPIKLDLASDVGPRPRRVSKRVYVGGTSIGGGAPIRVQSMCTTLTHDVKATLEQIARLQEVGCEIARVAVPDRQAADALPELVKRSILPLVADIHFDYRLALAALDAGVHKLRLNPGNIHNKDGVREVVRKAKERGTPIRIGVNHGSIGDRKDGDTRDEAQRMVDLAMSEIKILEDLDFDDIVVSVKAFEVPVMVAAYRRLAKLVPYPLHLGVTEAGTLVPGSIRSTAGMSVLLYEGIGDTIRVSLSEDPVEEVKAGYQILKSLGLRDQGLTLVACPSCGRADIDLIPLAKIAEERLRKLPRPMKVAVMGCEVNGPGEAKDADVGIAGGVGKGALFRKGKVVGVYPEDRLLDALLAEVDKILVENGQAPYSDVAPPAPVIDMLTPGRSKPAAAR